MFKKSLRLSLMSLFILVSHVYAGKIITDADVDNIVITSNKQFGFGGWNFDNIDVRIVNVNDFSGNVGTFNTNDGTYTTMGSDMSFESDIYNNTHDTIMGHLHGKDWPVGEPAGIKVINDDTKMQHGKPFNCIMTSSYLETGYLDVLPGAQPKPVICSSPFQSHKRFKINLLPTTVDGISPGNYGRPVDLVFNLDPSDTNASIRRYQVLQKANNYTDMRLDGYKIEIFDENGSTNNALTLSLGEGEGDAGADLWGVEDMANMSHGLWGEYEEGRFDNGFFDYKTVYYNVNLSDNNHTISYVGNMLGGNYQAIFGNWVPSIWEPMGIFHDDDHNPETDGVLKAFWGIAPGETEIAWWKSSIEYNPSTPGINPVYTWIKATEQDLEEWAGEWYAEEAVEDVLNLGLNYIINIGLNSEIGSTFILRITPHIAMDQTPPPYVCNANQHLKQGTLLCIDNTVEEFTPPYLPDYAGLLQGTSDTNPDANSTNLTLRLPVCGDGSLPTVQGTSVTCP